MNSLAVPIQRVKANFKPSHGLLAMLACLLLMAGTWLLLRNSSLVAVEKVEVTGLSGYYDRAARRAIVAEAQLMTTMNVDEQRLADVAAQFVDVSAIQTDSDFPHGLSIHVVVRRPVAVAKIGGTMVGLTGNGVILSDAQNLAGLPRIEISGPISRGHVTDAKAVEAVTVLSAAPDVLLRQVKAVKWGTRGLSVVLEKGLVIYFGGKSLAAAKWKAVAAVLAAKSSKGAHYIDVRIPDRPALGGLGAAPVTPRPQPLQEKIEPDPAATSAATGADSTQTQSPAAGPTAAAPAPAQPAVTQSPAAAGTAPAGTR